MFNKPASTENTINSTEPIVTPTPMVSENAPPAPQQSSSKKLFLIVTVVVLLLAAVFGVFVMMQKPSVDDWPDQPQPSVSPSTTPEPTEEAVFCTMDAKICPDGSSVGRVPPSCEFEACPGEEVMTNEEATDSADIELDVELDTDDDSTTSAMEN